MIQLSQIKNVIKKIFLFLRELIKENIRLLAAVIATGFLVLFLLAVVIIPSWKDPRSKFYGSKLGFPSVMRKLGKPLPVELAVVKTASFERWIMGEGTCASVPLLAPIIPMAVVKEVLVKPGDYVKAGQILARMDTSMAQIKIDSAKLAVETASSELARVNLGSAYVLAQERPEMEKVNLTAEEELTAQIKEKVDKYREAFQRGAVSRTAVLEVEGQFTEATRTLEKARLLMAMSEKGVKESIKIAENAVKDAKEALKHRERELEDYIVRAPGSGVIERILINPREYNQDSGKPGFVIASGRWFEAHFDQSDFSGVSPGLETQIHLEAFPGRLFTGRINLIIPVVSFNQGGPEISRPMRPRGSGAAEWAATFRTQINFENDEEEVALGMTGFARIRIQREGLAVPRGALISISAGSGYVNVVDAEDKWQSRLVEVGIVEETKAEILSGLVKGDRVIVRGHWVLEPGDAIGVVRTWDGFISPDKP